MTNTSFKTSGCCKTHTPKYLILLTNLSLMLLLILAFSALTLVVVWQEGHPACKIRIVL